MHESYSRHEALLVQQWLISYSYIKRFMNQDLLYKEEAYLIIGKCMEVHNQLGGGFLEIAYKDALEYEFRKTNILYEREKEYEVQYKGIILPHKFYADFVVFGKIILEVKSVAELLMNISLKPSII